MNVAAYDPKRGERRMGMNELLVAQKALKFTVDDLGEKVEWMEETIRGNGKPGINQRLALIELHLSRIDFWVVTFAKIGLPIITGIFILGLGAWVKSVI